MATRTPRELSPGRRSLAIASLLLALLGSSSCATRPSSLNYDEGEPLLVVKCARLPSSELWVSRCAEHSWIELRGKNSDPWQRVEVISAWSGVRISDLTSDQAKSDLRWGNRSVHVLSYSRGEEAQQLREQILARAPAYPDEESYVAFPGPNSNTFIEWLCREVDGFNVDLYSTAVGKDYAPWVRVGLSGTGYGVELETPILGVQLGLVEGVELHFIGMVVGVGLWPPKLKLPILPGLPYWGP